MSTPPECYFFPRLPWEGFQMRIFVQWHHGLMFFHMFLPMWCVCVLTDSVSIECAGLSVLGTLRTDINFIKSIYVLWAAVCLSCFMDCCSASVPGLRFAAHDFIVCVNVLAACVQITHFFSIILPFWISRCSLSVAHPMWDTFTFRNCPSNLTATGVLHVCHLLVETFISSGVFGQMA